MILALKTIHPRRFKVLEKNTKRSMPQDCLVQAYIHTKVFTEAEVKKSLFWPHLSAQPQYLQCQVRMEF